MEWIVFTLLTLPLTGQEVETFPAASAAEQGLAPEAVELLAAEVERLVAQDSAVGAELHVIQGRRTVLCRAFGFADREESRPMEVGSLYCVRSMTKPLVGTAIQMLLDEGALTLETKAAEILPEFDTPATRNITIEHLLTHTTGLPFTTIAQPLDSYDSLREVAAEAAKTKLLFRPGAGFQYSDAGSDTLGAIVAEITGAPVEEFLQEHLLDPLGMIDSVTLLQAQGPDIVRVPSAYSGSTGSWMRHWLPASGPIFPLFLTSQSLYSTTTDYARFLALWMDGGRDLLSAEAIERGLAPREILDPKSGFEGLSTFYGQQWTLYAPLDRSSLVAFGHNGSDGTHAWALPDRDLMVLFFTQTRGTRAGLELERILDRLLLRGDVEGHRAELEARASATASFGAYEGLYWDQTNARAYYVVRAEGDRLLIERPGSSIKALNATATPGHFSLEGSGKTLEFEDPVNGICGAFLYPFAYHTERQVRHQPDPDLPAAADIVAGLHQAHGLAAADEIGAIRLSGKFKNLTRGLEGRLDHIFDARRSRLIISMAGVSEVVWITEDERVFTQINGGEVSELEGVGREQTLLRHPLRRFGDWRKDYASVEVLRKIRDGDGRALLVRTVSPQGSGSTKLIDPETGRLIGEDRFETVPGAGPIGIHAVFDDYRDVEGLMLPFRSRYHYKFMLAGDLEFSIDSYSTGFDPGRSLQPPLD